jgi:hypothetical protein
MQRIIKMSSPHTTDHKGIYGEVKKMCTDHPSMPVSDAPYIAYRMIEAQHR